MVKNLIFDVDVFSETLNEYISNVSNVQYKAKLETKYFDVGDESCQSVGIDFDIILDKEQITGWLGEYRLVSCPLYKDDLIKLRDQINIFLKEQKW